MTTRTITTAAELDALPVWAVVEDVLGIAWVRHPGTPDRTDHWVSYYGDRLSAQYVAAESPLTVLHDPSAPVVPVVSDTALEAVERVIDEWERESPQTWAETHVHVDMTVEAAKYSILQDLRRLLAVVREHAPVRPDRETVARALDPRPWDSTHTPVGWSQPSIEVARERSLTQADAVLALWPGESRATVQAEALQDAATQLVAEDNNQGDWWDDEANEYCAPAEWLRARADRARADR